MSRFTRGRRARRPDDNRFLPKDVQAWRALIRAARYQARAPEAKPDALRTAASRAARAVPPKGEGHKGSVFLQLVMAGRDYWRVLPEAKAEAASRLGELARACAAVLDAPPPPPPGQGRADLYG